MTELLFEVPREKVSWISGGKEYGVEVRGINDEDLISLLKGHKDQLVKAFEAIESKGESIEKLEEFGPELLSEFPELVAKLIALAADNPDGAPVVRKWPAPIKLRALITIWNLKQEDGIQR